MREQAVTFGTAGNLVGVTTEPDAGDPARRPAAIFLNSGLVHRAGPNRLNVRLARLLAERGLTSLRFDFSGIGESAPRADKMSYEQRTVAETREAMDYLGETRGCDRFVLIGLCSGALTALQTAACDARVVGAALINTRGGSQQLRDYIKRQAAADKYIRLAWNDPRTWLSAVRSNVSLEHLGSLLRGMARDALSSLARRRQMREEAAALADAWNSAIARGANLLLVYSQWDPGLKFLQMTLGDELSRYADEGRIELHVIPGADHTFTPPAARERLFSIIQQWSDALQSAAAEQRDPCTSSF